MADRTEQLEETRLVLGDGRSWRGRLNADRQAALWAGALHRGRPGLVEVVSGRRLADGSLRMRSRRYPGNYLPAGEVDRLVALVRARCKRGEEVFATPLTRERPQPGRAGGILPAGVCWVDLDDPERVERLRVFAHRPHMVVASGGGLHAYWRLAATLSVADVEGANRKLAGALGGDLKCTDAPRIMRVPGSVNHKAGRACLVVHVDLARPPVDPTELLAGLADPEPPAPPRDQDSMKRSAHLNAEDPARALSPPAYFQLLVDVAVPERGGNTRCPLPGHDDRNASLHIYPSSEQGWWCFGCQRGGAIYDLASLLEGGPWGRALCDDEFRRVKTQVWQRLGLTEIGGPNHSRETADAGVREEQDMNRQKGDPHWITTRFPSSCHSCRSTVGRGERALYSPRHRAVSCSVCGQVEEHRSQAQVLDEPMGGAGH